MRDDDDDALHAPPDRGSLGLGFLAGLVGGCVVLALVLRRGKPETRMGVWIGLVVQILVALLWHYGK